MTKLKAIIIVAVTSLVVINSSSCYYDNAEDLLGSTTCDTTSVSYANDIVPIMSASCYLCHSNAAYVSIGGGILLEGYDAIQTVASSGSLVGATDFLAGYSPMPKSAPQLPSCDRALIRNWVNQGIQNN